MVFPSAKAMQVDELSSSSDRWMQLMPTRGLIFLFVPLFNFEIATRIFSYLQSAKAMQFPGTKNWRTSLVSTITSYFLAQLKTLSWQTSIVQQTCAFCHLLIGRKVWF